MRRPNLTGGFLALGAAMLLASAVGAGPSFEFTSTDFPQAVQTVFNGIGPGGDIVGNYVDRGANQHGFLLSHGDFTSIDYPGALATRAGGITSTGDMVGSYTNAPGGPANIHGYLLGQGTFSEVQYPGYLGSRAASRQTAIFMDATTTTTSWRACTGSSELPPDIASLTFLLL